MGAVPLQAWILTSLFLVGAALWMLWLFSDGGMSSRFRVLPRPSYNRTVASGRGAIGNRSGAAQEEYDRLQPESNKQTLFDSRDVTPLEKAKANPPKAEQPQKQDGVQRRLPNTILIGVRKGGTRALLEMLALHPNVQSSGQEVHFFDRDINYGNGLSWYLARMKPSKPGDVVIEKSPAYFVIESVPERMLADLGPDIKLLLVLRNPIRRVVSDFMQGQHHQRGKMIRVANLSQSELRAMQKLLEARILNPADGSIKPTANFIRVSLYAQHLVRWLRYFPLERFFIMSMEQLVSQPATTLKDFAAFLGLPAFDWDAGIVHVDGAKLPCLNHTHGPRPELVCLNTTKGREHIPIPESLERKLFDFFQPHNERLFRLIGKTFDSWRHTAAEDEQDKRLKVKMRTTNLVAETKEKHGPHYDDPHWGGRAGPDAAGPY